ncbi:dynein axonemal heavy chain 6 [Episyrphus balteatus]|uniref:dynein axonemal heavy chain 6 n=1 Tax=Episyrphus balteatus TaxID=286459 RepID=UPI002485793D|nr:dynein axonemal heavy chain 6 [Episyrphus balteatus]
MRKTNFLSSGGSSKYSSENIQNRMKDMVFHESRKKSVVFKRKSSDSASSKLKQQESLTHDKRSVKVTEDESNIQIPDLNSIIENKIKKFKGEEFIYLTYTVPKNSEYFTPYSLAETQFKDIPSKSQYYTMSRHGVTFWSQGENYFTELNQWQREFQMYIHIVKIKSFAKFRMWKGFKVWEKTLKWRKYDEAYTYLSENLFYAIPHLASAALQLRSDFYQMQNLNFINVEVIEDWQPFYFMEIHMKIYEEMKMNLKYFRDKARKYIYDACHGAIIAKGFFPTDEIDFYPSVKKMREAMSFMDRARKRGFCKLLCNFLNYCDRIVLILLHTITRNSFEALANALRIHDELGPTVEELKSELGVGIEVEAQRPSYSPQNPFFMAELLLKPESVDIEPSEDAMKSIFHQLTNLILDSVMEIKSFTEDATYKIFTEPSIMGRQEERLAEPPPDLAFLFRIDKEFQENRKFIFSVIRSAYEKVYLYAERFEMIRLNYETDAKTDASVIRNERSLEALRAFCERYHANMHAIDGVLSHVNLGLLKLTQSSFKDTITPECLRLLNVLAIYLPKLAVSEVEKIQLKAEEFIAKITSAPTTTTELVAHLRYLTNVEADLEILFKEVDYAHDCFILIKDFNIFIDQQEKEKYMDTEDLVVTCKETLQEKQGEKEIFIQQLNAILQEDIKMIFEEIRDVAAEVQDFKFLDKKSDPDETKLQLGALLERLNECQEKAQEYRSYQKDFKIDVTRYDEMEHAFQEIRMRQNLWNSLEEWETSLELWQKLGYQNLNVENMSNLNAKILKSCIQFEKYLPPNELVPGLKTSAELFREKLPVLGYLRNPNLKTRHYTEMENILGIRIYHEENILISTFESAHAFDEENSNQLMDISSQATGEAQLENMLRNIENIWKETELLIVPHRDSKDVFVLMGTDELQVVLDDSNVNINTIAASKYVGPIKSKVDEWISMMEQFGETMEEWSNCQTSWIYLEAIFASPDIQRQLPNEAKMFTIVDRSFKEIMRNALKVSLALPVMTNVDTYNTFREHNRMLDSITRGLEAYLEVKRVVFPRFYFLSNDELLEILAQTRVPQAVQPHLRKCFDAISKLEFGQKESGDGGKMIATNDIVAMLSPEGEKLLFGKGLKARGAVEEWLSKVEEAMFLAVKRYMKFGYQCYPVKERHKWFEDHPNQVVLTVSQQQWAAEIHAIYDGPDEKNGNILKSLKAFEKKCFDNLSALAAITRKEITNLLRKVLCALITVDVHARDSVTNLLEKNVVKSTDFNWLKMLRFYWQDSTETMVSQMASAKIPYYYEYLGAGGVLVLTPLTDRCYLCLMGALQMDLGGAPAGPAGTGKTETTKDLAKAVAKQCVVFNCSEGLDFKMMGRFFSGLAQCGAWCCFDEFNRIDIEVLSVIAQQLITIRNAKVANVKRFIFEGREIKLNKSCSVYITMNPGYAGRTELPDNLKALFRPISMMVPDYALISEVILYSEGFEDPKVLAHKMVQMYKLCSEQLSQQNHYDFGMRAVKSVLVMAGSLKRSAPSQREDITLIAALRDSNIPKFLADDAFLFRGILSDLFPGVELPDSSHPELQQGMVVGLEEKNLQPVPSTIRKCIQLYETMCVRWGVMLVGPTGGGKSTVLHALEYALTYLYKNEVSGPHFREVVIQKLNPKSVSMNELYGYVNLKTMEWQDGLLGLAVRTAVNNEDEIHQWIVCDGPVDAVWIENMNTVLDDNKMLCLANSERIKLTPWVHMVFEVQDLAQASPATVSRCGMVYVDPEELGCLPLIQSWRNGSISKLLTPEQLEFIHNLFKNYFEKFIKISIKHGTFPIHQVVTSKTVLCCELLTALIETLKITSLQLDIAKSLLTKLFVWSTLWSVASNFREESQAVFENRMREVLSEETILKELPEVSIWEYRVNLEQNQWEKWQTILEPFNFNPLDKYFDMQVPTVDTTKFGYICQLLFLRKFPVMITGDTGVGKTVLAMATLKKLAKRNFVPVLLNFSAQTSSIRTQEMIEAQLEKRKRTLLSAPIGKSVIIFIDDVNMPKLDTYGSQPPIELLRQFLDCKGFYDREKLYWKDVIDVALGVGCAPPGGGRNPLTPRLVRHFALLNLPKPNNDTLTTIFAGILSGFLNDFCAAIRPLAIPLCNALVEVYSRIAEEMLPTPDKSHYIFNLRDLSKCVQGILQSDSSNYSTDLQMLRLFYHENMRVYFDRLINSDDENAFKTLMSEVCEKHFNKKVVAEGEVVLFGDFMIFGQNRAERIYEEIKDFEKLESILMDFMDDYNSSTGKDMKLIMFQDALEHTVRLARLLRADRGNGLLVGVAGMGKQSLTRLAAHVNEYKCFQIELRRNYDIVAFHEDLRALYRIAGVENTPLVFLIVDTQIVEEEFLEDINNILNSGEVPNLFEGDEYEKIILDSRESCNESNKAQGCSRDDIYKFFINRVRNNLHVVISMSPVGDAFRRRCRMFPSLVNCTTIDWFSSWPAEALYSVAIGVLQDVAEKQEDRERLAKTSVFMHKSVEEASVQFYKEMKRHYYTTPSSYLELLKLYKSILKSRTDIIVAKRKRISNGLNKILETNRIIAVMQKDLEVMVPQLDEESTKMKELLAKLEIDTKNSDAVKESVAKDEAVAKEKAELCRTIADDAMKDLEIAMPALQEAENALKGLSKADINEIKAFTTPPQLVQFVMEAVCILLGAKPTWASAKSIMADVNFLKRLMDYDKEHIPEATLKKVKNYIDHKDFVPAKIEKVSKVAKGVSLWVIAIDKFAKVYKVVEPKIKRQKSAEAELNEVMKVLRTKQQELADVEAKIQTLRDSIEVKSREFKIIQDSVDLTYGRINRAGRLTSALADEEIRWKETVEVLSNELWAVPGDVLVSSACVAYLGAFSADYRRNLTDIWVAECHKYEIPSSVEFSLLATLGDAYEMRSWTMAGLPRDTISVENGLYATRALRWPLMIDPQEQANRWIRNLEKGNNLYVLKMTDGNFLRILENAIRQGFPVLLEDIDETVDPALRPILQRETFIQEGRVYLKLGEVVIDYDDNFKLYMTTKLSNPHYLPEICINVTLVNFLVTEAGLEDQLLADIVAIELPALEIQRNDLIVKINTDKQQLLALEDKVLKLLFHSKGNILDDEELVETLNDAKETSLIIAARLIDTEETEKMITATRERYRSLASRGAILYFVIAGLAEIDPMYQYSLKYFSMVFCNVIQAEHPTMDTEERIAQLKEEELKAMFLNVSRGLFENHKIIFSFILSLAIEKQEGRLHSSEFNFLTRGIIGTFDMKSKPDSVIMTSQEWSLCCFMDQSFPEFKGLCEDVKNKITINIDEFKEVFNFGKSKNKSIINWNAQLSNFQKLMLVKAFRKEKFTSCVSAYVRSTIGSYFVDISGGSQLKNVYLDTSNITPLVFVLSSGSDPMAGFLKFAEEMQYTDKFYSISLGQGQGPIAESLIERSLKTGHWVFLQNCHLATSWMQQMENIVRSITLGLTKAHSDFRLFLSSMPTRSFPISVLQNSVKLTNEPPKGIKANVLGALADLQRDFFEHHILGARWRALVFGICMFHSVILERRKFGPLGWNIMYEFNESDRECGIKTLDVFIDRKQMAAEDIPWEAIAYINGEITWGGRVTDYWDLRCLRTILKTFSSPIIIDVNYTYSSNPFYRNPRRKTLEEYREYVQTFPTEEDPELFGMNKNANIVFQTKETDFFISTLLLGQPKAAGDEGQSADNETCLEVIQKIKDVLVTQISRENMHPTLSVLDDKGQIPSLTTVLIQESDRYNVFLKIVHDSLNNLNKAIKGLVVMSEALEEVFWSLLNNFVPKMWTAKSFLSIKPLPNYIADFQRRIDFMQDWIENGTPRSYWLSGLYFPQSFLTGILQTHARKYLLPIDVLKIDFSITDTVLVQQDFFEKHQKGEEDQDLYANLKIPDVGVIAHGIFIEAARWEQTQGGLCDAREGELYSRLPAVHFIPVIKLDSGERYDAPLYKTQARSGVLSTTGHSTNFILSILLESKKPPDFWILRGTALVSAVSENDS